jgi:hypothetical protein
MSKPPTVQSESASFMVALNIVRTAKRRSGVDILIQGKCINSRITGDSIHKKKLYTVHLMGVYHLV